MKPEDKTITGTESATGDDRPVVQTESGVDPGRRNFLSGAGALGVAAAMPLVIAPRWARAAKWPERSRADGF